MNKNDKTNWNIPFIMFIFYLFSTSFGFTTSSEGKVFDWFGWLLWHINHCRLFNA